MFILLKFITSLYITGWFLSLLGDAKEDLLAPRIAFYCPFECYCDMDGIRCSNLSISEIGDSLSGNISYIYMSEAALPPILTHREVEHIRNRDVKVLAILASDVVDIEHGAFANISKFIGKVKLQSNNIISLREGVFVGFEPVKELDLAKNIITNIQSGVFRELKNLKTLVLSENRLVKLEDGIFLGLTHLKTLLLDNNLISIIQQNAFLGLWTLNKLDLSGNRIKQIGAEVFGSLSNLQALLLNQNKLTCLTSIAFPNLKKLKLLNLQTNYISRIKNGAFKGLSSLVELWLDQNNLTNLCDESFKGLLHLAVLSLSHNRLTVLQPAWFSCLINVRHLYLEGNNITYFPASILEPMPALSALYLGNNNISWLSANALLNKRLKQISLHGNPLHCDCAMKRIWAEYQVYIPNLRATGQEEEMRSSGSQARCLTPAQFKGKSWDILYILECRNISSRIKLHKNIS